MFPMSFMIFMQMQKFFFFFFAFVFCYKETTGISF